MVDLLKALTSEHYLLVLVDYFSTFVDVSIMKSVTLELGIRELEILFKVHGNPEFKKTDDRPQLILKEFSTFLKEKCDEKQKTRIKQTYAKEHRKVI